MFESDWTLGAVLGLLGLHALLLYRLTADSATQTDGAERPDGRVDCPECGAANESGYRYCRSCVTELPGGTTVDRQPSAVPGRLMR